MTKQELNLLNKPLDKVERVVVVGGGIAGSLAAAALAKVWGKSLSISVIAPEKSPPDRSNRIVASFPTLRALHALLAIPEADLLRSIGASFTLGSSFQGWSDAHSSWFQPFGETGARLGDSAFHQQWLRLWRRGKAEKFETYSFAAQAARRGRFAFPRREAPPLLRDYDFGLHFEAGRYIAYMRRYAAGKGVKVIPDQVVDVGLDGENGFIRSLGLAGGGRIEGDLFIDCTGGASVLLGTALKINFVPDADFLPCDRIVTASTKPTEFPALFSEVTTAAAGWRWKIPTLVATGHGYAFSSQHLSDGEACHELTAGLPGEIVDAPAVTAIQSGRLEKVWHGNCVAIGAAAGSFEPLEFVALHMIHSGISKLVTMFPGKSCSGGESDEFNRLTALEIDRIRDKMSLHYRGGRRDETAFWRAATALKCSDMLVHKLDHFASRGRAVMYEEESFETFQWISAFLGLGVIPERSDILAESTDLADVESALTQMRRDIEAALKTMPTHQQFLEHMTHAG